MNMRIDRIEPSRRKQGRVLIILDGGTRLRVTEREIADFGLRAGDELDAETLGRLRDAAGVSDVRARAVEMLARRPLSRRALTRKLCEKGATPQEADAAADWLTSIGALNEEDYAASLARQYAAKGYGPSRIRAKLYEKGVPQALWDAAMSDVSDDGARIDAYLTRKLAGRVPDKAEKQRLTAALLRRGFSWEEIRAAWTRTGQDMEVT